ncbi:MAG: DUF881 domain-containing protein [Armatimonadota bacterium]
MVNPFVKIHNEKWVLPVSALSAVLGFMMFASWLTNENRDSVYSYLNKDQQGRVSLDVIDLDQYRSLQREVDTLRKRATELEKTVAAKNIGSGALNDQLQDAKIFAGLTELEGPGVKVTLRDNPKAGLMPVTDDLVHDTDVLRVTNELFNSGAEAVSVNGQRLMASSNIRCAGTTILVDGVKVANPFVILAIGKEDVLYSGFTMQGGVMSELVGASPAMVQITKEKSIRVPAYLGSTSIKSGVVPKATTK